MAEKRPKKKAPRAEAGGPTSGSPMDVGLLEQMVRLMAANDLNTVDVRDGDRRVVLKRGPAVVPFAGGYVPPPTGMPVPAATTPPSSPSAPRAGGGGGAPTAPAGDDESKLHAIKSPMVGTFYASPKPGEKPFVGVGSRVEEETDVCLVEAMKNYFPVKAAVRGTIAKVLVGDGQTVQFDQPMFLVKPG